MTALHAAVTVAVLLANATYTNASVAALQGDGDKLVSAARDGTVRVWDVEAGKERFRLQGFTRYVGSLHLTPSRLIADGTNNAICCLDFAPLDGAEPD